MSEIVVSPDDGGTHVTVTEEDGVSVLLPGENPTHAHPGPDPDQVTVVVFDDGNGGFTGGGGGGSGGSVTTSSKTQGPPGPPGPQGATGATGAQGPAGDDHVFIQPDPPTSPPSTYLWFETGLGGMGGTGPDMTLWVEDGT